MTVQPTSNVKPELCQPREPYQKPVLECLQGWKMLTGAPISVSINNDVINFDVTHFGLDGN